MLLTSCPTHYLPLPTTFPAAGPGSALAPAPLDCGVAEQGCLQQEPCAVLYRLLEYCVAEEAVAPLGADARWECLEAQHALQQYRPLQACKCQRGSRREEHCLKVYWTVRFSGGWGGVCVCVCEMCIYSGPIL